MEITKEYLEGKVAEYKQVSEKLKLDAIANDGAAQAVQQILNDLVKEEQVVNPS
jgi:hypothetical protein